jgi:hypothetical protein
MVTVVLKLVTVLVLTLVIIMDSERTSAYVPQIQSQVIGESGSRSLHPNLSIETPVPLLYSARSKAVLDSMISSRSSGTSSPSLPHFQNQTFKLSDSGVFAMNVAEHLMALEHRDSKEVYNFCSFDPVP